MLLVGPSRWVVAARALCLFHSSVTDDPFILLCCITEACTESLTMALQLAALCAVAVILLALIRRKWLSPISDIPGPFWGSFSRAWQLYHIFDGHTEVATIKAHEKYGTFVRISHQEVSVSDPEAIKTLLVAPLRKGSWYQIFNLPDGRVVNQMGELDPKSHIAKQRNVASGYAFSNVIQSEPYIDSLIRKMEDRFDQFTKLGKPIEFDHWFN